MADLGIRVKGNVQSEGFKNIYLRQGSVVVGSVQLENGLRDGTGQVLNTRINGDLQSFSNDSALPRWDWDWPFGVSAPLWERGEAFYSAGEMAVFEEVTRRVRRELEDLGYGSGVFGPIHRDLTFKNLLFGARQEGAGATDFDQCGLGHYLFDPSVVLRSLRPLWRSAGRPELAEDRAREALFEGYDSVRDLPTEHERRLATFDAMQRVAAVNRALELRASPAASPQARGEGFLRQSVAWLERSYLA